MRGTTYVVKNNPQKIDLGLYGIYDPATKKLFLTSFSKEGLAVLGVVLELAQVEPSGIAQGE